MNCYNNNNNNNNDNGNNNNSIILYLQSSRKGRKEEKKKENFDLKEDKNVVSIKHNYTYRFDGIRFSRKEKFSLQNNSYLIR